MRKIYKLYIGIILSVIAVACSDNLDSDKYFKDRRSLEDVFTDKESITCSKRIIKTVRTINKRWLDFC